MFGKDKVGANVVLLHGCPQSCMPNPVESLLEVYEDMVEVLLVLEIFFTEDSKVEDLCCGAPFCSETCLFFSDGLLRLWLQSVQYDLQHDWTCTGRNKTLPPSTSLPVMGEIAGVNMASLGGYLHSSKKRARWV